MEIKEKKRRISPRGYVPMLVGRGEKIERFLVHTKLLNHPLIRASLELASQEFGFEQQGVLQIPCDIERFRMALEMMSKNGF